MSHAESLASHGGHPDRHTLPGPIAASLASGRARQQLSIRQAAALIGISHGYLYYLERGLRAPSVSVARSVARVLLRGQPEAAQALLAAAVPGAGRDWKPPAATSLPGPETPGRTR